MKRTLALILASLFLLSALTGCNYFKEENVSADLPPIVISADRHAAMTERYRAVLDGTAPFTSTDAAAEVTVQQLSLTLGSDSAVDVKISAFAEADLDYDGEPEVLLWLIADTNHSYGYTVLHHIGDTVYGYTVPYASLVDLRKDGAFSFYQDEHHRGCARMTFTETGYELNKLSHCDGPDAYVVDGVDATAEEYALAMTRHSSKTRAIWHHFSSANIQEQFPS